MMCYVLFFAKTREAGTGRHGPGLRDIHCHSGAAANTPHHMMCSARKSREAGTGRHGPGLGEAALSELLRGPEVGVRLSGSRRPEQV